MLNGAGILRRENGTRGDLCVCRGRQVAVPRSGETLLGEKIDGKEPAGRGQERGEPAVENSISISKAIFWLRLIRYSIRPLGYNQRRLTMPTIEQWME